MNRHFINYFPDEGLGTPIRREESKSRETPWAPTDTPGYVRRINEKGQPEVSHVGNLPPPEPVITILADCAAQAPEAATLGTLHETGAYPPDAAHQLQEGAPPERGWYLVQPFGPGTVRHAYWSGERWSYFCTGMEAATPHAARSSYIASIDTDYHKMLPWRGHRITGPDWPEAL
jgi:hypothetical protein